MRAFPWQFRDSSWRFKTLWSGVGGVILHTSRIGSLGKCVYIVIQLWYGIVVSFCPKCGGLFVLCVKASHRIEGLPTFFSTGSDFLTNTASSTIKLPEKVPTIFAEYPPHLYLLLSDRDEKDEMSVGFLDIAQSSKRQYCKRIFHQLRVEVSAELLDVGDMVRGRSSNKQPLLFAHRLLDTWQLTSSRHRLLDACRVIWHFPQAQDQIWVDAKFCFRPRDHLIIRKCRSRPWESCPINRCHIQSLKKKFWSSSKFVFLKILPNVQRN